ncbi:MAG: recombinase family protein [Parvibaculum sp.]|uniref:recombinase family protein n=1 Tax=Parvibaculum sp. TaxID=2024848 RepID=UPI00391C1A10
MAIYAYVRVSTARQASEGESLEVQRRQIDGYLAMNGWAADRVFVEEGVSGAKPLAERPQGARLLQTLKAGDTLVAAKLDRVFRSALDALQMTETLRLKGVGLHLIDLGGDVSGNGLSKLFLTIAAAFAEAERDRIRERVQNTKADQKERGRFLGGRRPFGFTVGADGNLEKNAEEQEAIRKAKRMRKAGKSLRAIAETLRSDGHRISHEGVARIVSD